MAEPLTGLPWGQAARFTGGKMRLSNAYKMARQLPRNADLRLDLAAVLIDHKRFDLAIRHASKAVTLAPHLWERLEETADTLLELGAFKPARKLYEQLIKQEPENANALAHLAALLERAKEHEGATTYIKASARALPYELPEELDPNLPTVLRIRAVDRSKYSLKKGKKSGLYRIALSRGHFSIQSLVQKSKINLLIVSITEGFMPPLADLPPIDAIINTVSCADRYPEALGQIADYLAGFKDVPVINDPARVALTSREMMAERLGELEGVRFPQTHLIERSTDTDKLITQIETLLPQYPIIIREAGTQTGISVKKIDKTDQLRAYLDKVPTGQGLYVIEYIDCLGKDGFFHKTRAFFIDNQFYPVANLSSDEWQIHSGDRYRVMDKTPATQEAEKAYLSNPETYLGKDVFTALHRIRDAVQLDFFGIDYTVTPAGELVIFEANPAMRHNFDHARAFPYTRPYLQTISAAFNDMLHNRIAAKN